MPSANPLQRTNAAFTPAACTPSMPDLSQEDALGHHSQHPGIYHASALITVEKGQVTLAQAKAQR